MPQRIFMEEAQTDIDQLQDIITGLEKFGIIHEDKTNDIMGTMLEWVINNPTYNTEMLNEMKEDGDYNPDDFDSRMEFIWDNYGDGYWYDLVLGENIETSDKEIASLMFRHIVSEYLWSNEYKEREDVITECERYLED